MADSGGRDRKPKRKNAGAGDESRAVELLHDEAAEEALLGAALYHAAALEVLATRLRPEDFSRPNNGHIAAALIDAFEKAWPAEPRTVAEYLERQGLLEQVGGLAHLLSLIVNAPSASSTRRYVEIVADRATRRRMIGAASEIRSRAFDLSLDVHDAVTKAQDDVSNVAANNGSRTYSGLRIAELGPYVAGKVELEEPSILRRTDGRALFYAGKIHAVQAEPSTGKTWVILRAVAEVLGFGGAVGYLDYEDSPAGITNRLQALRVSSDAIVERLRYIQVEGAMGLPEKVELKGELDRLNPDLVVIDGVAEAIAREGYDETDNTEVALWIDKFPRWLARMGPAVVMIDHVAKDPNTRGRYARGAGHKLGAADGVVYSVIVSQSFSRHKAGRVQLRIEKDRPGGVGANGEIAAAITITPAADGQIVDIQIDPPNLAEPGEVWEPTHLMQKVSAELESSTVPLTARSLKLLISAKRGQVEKAIARLLARGYVTVAREGSTEYLRSVRPYRSPAESLPVGVEPEPDTGPAPEPPATLDEELFADNPGMTKDELAERRAKREAEQKGDDEDG